MVPPTLERPAYRGERARVAEYKRLYPLAYSSTPKPLVSFASCEDRFRVLTGPNQGGKTFMGAKEAAWFMGAGKHPHRRRFNAERPWSNKPTCGWILCFTKESSVTVQRALYALIPKSMLVTKEFHEKVGFTGGYIELTNGSWAKVKTVNQDTMSLASEHLDWIWADEPFPDSIWDEILSRLFAHNGSFFATMTAVNAPVEHIVEKVKDGTLTHFRFELSVDACPHLTQRQIDSQIRLIRPSARAQRIYGLWSGPSENRAIECFSGIQDQNNRPEIPDVGLGAEGEVLPDIAPDSAPMPQGAQNREPERGNTVPAYYAPHGKGTTYLCLSIDYGEKARRTICHLTATRFIGGRKTTWFLAEWRSSTVTSIGDDADAIIDLIEGFGLNIEDIDIWVGDVNTAGKLSPGSTLNDLMEEAIWARRQATVSFQKPSKGAGSVERGVTAFNEGFADGSILVSESCPHLIATCSHWQGTDKGTDNNLKHAFDSAHYNLEAVLDIDLAPRYLEIRYPNPGNTR